MIAAMSDPATANAASEGRKRHLHGTHRVATPRETLARVSRLCAAAGITRVSMVTGLDRIGIPVAVACRPNSRSLSVFQGKGLSIEAAKVSAIMEALEVHHAEHASGPLRFASTAEMRVAARIAEPVRLPRLSRDAWDEHEPILWFEGRVLASGEPAWIPFELVNARYALPHPPGGYRFAASTNGLASGNEPLEAILHGLYETIERDAIALWLQGDEAARKATALAPPPDGPAAEMLARCAAAGIRATLWDATSDIGVATVVCLIRAGDEAVSDMGSGCHADRGVALLRAVTEAAQSRLTRVSGAREDFGEEAYPRDPRASDGGGHAVAAMPTARRMEDLPDFAAPTLQADLREVAARLGASGFEEVFVADLTDPAFGIPVCRVVVPGLEGPAHSPAVAYAPGARARARMP